MLVVLENFCGHQHHFPPFNYFFVGILCWVGGVIQLINKIRNPYYSLIRLLERVSCAAATSKGLGVNV